MKCKEGTLLWVGACVFGCGREEKRKEASGSFKTVRKYESHQDLKDLSAAHGSRGPFD